MSRFFGGGGFSGFPGGGGPATASLPRPQQPAAPTGPSNGPFPTYRFQVEISGITVAEFSECSGLEVKVKTETIRQGGQNEFTHQLPGRIEYGNLTLRRGFVNNSELFAWCMSVLNRPGKPVQRKDVTVSLVAPSRDGGSRPIFQWTFLGAYPVKWTGPTFKANDNGVSMEALELAHEGLR
jgi:phage tail-like protein